MLKISEIWKYLKRIRDLEDLEVLEEFVVEAKAEERQMNKRRRHQNVGRYKSIRTKFLLGFSS